MTGIEFEVDSETSKDEFYFLIRKQFRENASSARTLACYYVVGVDPSGMARGTVYPLPDMHSVFTTNLVRLD